MLKRILITGGTGRIGVCAANALREAGYDVLIGTRGPGNGADIIHIDYSDQSSVTKALKGIHTVIHLAFYMRSDNFVEQHIDGNLKTAYYLYEAARINGVKRVIFGSSNHVFGFYEKGEHITSDSLYRPDSNYALCKVFVEMIGRYYSDRFGVSCINLRIGNYVGNPSAPKDDRATYVWLSSPDCARLFVRAVEHDESCMYLQMFGMSANDGCFYDTSDNDKIGYEPADNGASYRGKTSGGIMNAYYGTAPDEITKHKYVGGYNCVMDQNGAVDLAFLRKIMDQTGSEKSPCSSSSPGSSSSDDMPK